MKSNDKDNNNNNNEGGSQKIHFENKITRKISSVLEFLAEIYELKKEYLLFKNKFSFKNVLACYEKAYYLNLGRYGPKNVNTEYFKIKMGIFNDQIKNSNKNNINTGISFLSSGSKNNYSNKKEISSFINNVSSDSSIKVNKTHNNSNNTTFKSIKSVNDIKGATSTFKFSIAYTNLYEPFVVGIYDLMTNFENENIFIKKLYFDKNQLTKYFKLTKVSCNELYSDFYILK